MVKKPWKYFDFYYNNALIKLININDPKTNSLYDILPVIMEKENGENVSNYMLFQSLNVSMYYLKRNLIEHIIYISNYKMLDINTDKCLVLDANTLSNLDIF